MKTPALKAPAPSSSPQESPAWLYPAGVVAVFALIFLSRTVRLWEADVFMHVRVGQWIFEQRAVPRLGIFSLVAKDLPWLDHEWLFQLLVYLGQKAAGWAALGLARSILLTLSFVVLWRSSLLLGTSRALALAVTFSAACFAGLNVEFRPQVCSFLFLPLSLHIFYRHLAGRRGPLWLLPFIMLLWVNLHGAFIVFFMSAAAFLAGEYGKWFLARYHLSLGPLTPKERLHKLAAALALAFAASFANPYGWRLWTFPFKAIEYNFAQVIHEWMPPTPAYFLPFFILLGACCVVLGFSRRQLDLTHLLLIVSWGWMALSSRRHIALFAYVAMPLLGLYLQRLLASPPRPNASGAPSPLRLSLWVLVLLGAWQFSNFERMQNHRLANHFGLGADTRSLPEKTATFVQRERPGGNLFNEYDLGGYLIYLLPPQYPVFQDGRLDLYGRTLFEQYRTVESALPGWQEILKRYQVNMAILSYAHTPDPHSLISELDASADWALVYWDDQCLVYVRNAGANQELARRLAYRHSFPGQPPSRMLKTPQALKLALAEAERKLAEDPTSRRAAWLKAYCLQRL